jgi:hypothetical protein
MHEGDECNVTCSCSFKDFYINKKGGASSAPTQELPMALTPLNGTDVMIPPADPCCFQQSACAREQGCQKNQTHVHLLNYPNVSSIDTTSTIPQDVTTCYRIHEQPYLKVHQHHYRLPSVQQQHDRRQQQHNFYPQLHQQNNHQEQQQSQQFNP